MAKNKNKNKQKDQIVMVSSTQDDDKIQEEEERENFTYAMQLVNASVLPMTLKTAIDLGILNILASAGPNVNLSAEEIAVLIPTRNPEAPGMLERILRLLVSYSVLGCSVGFEVQGTERKYCLGPVAKYFVRDEDGVSLAPLMALTHDKVFLESWSGLKDAILEGGTPFNRVHGMQLFEYPTKDPRFGQVYNTAMFNRSTLVVKKMLKSYVDFKNLKQVVDVGGGIGVALSLITSKYPSVKGINFDLPHVIQHAPPFPGVKHVEGDMFESVPKGDAIILMWILHDWDDKHCLKLLKNCYDALPDNGKVIVVEQILPMMPEVFAVAKDKSQVDVLSLTQSPGGRERMQHEIIFLATEAGFKGVGFTSYVYHYWVLEFLKTSSVLS
ncbi:hypothetical protein JCGZ_14175 [Jatropha curcas]|uniref:caffeate O-methyltransferase n=1 Tax=Jatropha curcas TaxID=180498 RepID=A0A067K9B4_JATCU|nr:hypothetical protein JCGZ_14175 [Jatropha curcas]